MTARTTLSADVRFLFVATQEDQRSKRGEMSDKLKPCPFCGSEANSGSCFSPCESITYAWCSNNECELHLIDDCHFTPETWNRRPSQGREVHPVSNAAAWWQIGHDAQAAERVTCCWRCQQCYPMQATECPRCGAHSP